MINLSNQKMNKPQGQLDKIILMNNQLNLNKALLMTNQLNLLSKAHLMNNQ
jgi:hypothetical protein